MISARTQLLELLRRPKVQRCVWLLAILAVLGFYKARYNVHTTDTGIDGGYYTNIAMHLRDGRGLVTDISLLHKGYHYFPHPTAIYPLWPLVYGYTARFFPLFETGKWLATLFYFVALVLGYLWARTLTQRPLLPRWLPGFGAGHLFVLFLGLNYEFFIYTTRTNTEGLAFALTMLMLLRASHRLAGPSWLGGLELGVLCGLAFLARSPMLILLMALIPVIACAAVVVRGSRPAYASMGLFAVIGFVAALTPQYLHLRTFIEDPGFHEMVRFDQVRFCDRLSPLHPLIGGLSPIDYLVDRAKGIPIAFGLNPKRSYGLHFHTFHWALLVTLPLLAFDIARTLRREGFAAQWRRLCTTDRVAQVMVVLLAIGGFLAIHTMHKHRAFDPWVFHRRHALLAGFLFYLSMLYLLTRFSRIARFAGWAILISSCTLGLLKLHDTTAMAVQKTPAPYKPALVEFLHDHRGPDGSLTVAMPRPQRLAPHTRGVHYHWCNRITTFEDITVMVDELGAEYVVVPRRGRYRFMRDKRWGEQFRRVGSYSGNNVFQRNDSQAAF